ncbi:MAG: TniQ family protein [Ktedonobacterales bacterium]
MRKAGCPQPALSGGSQHPTHPPGYVDPTWERLPIHPPPQPLESQTSYFMRVVEANGLHSLKELGLLAGEKHLYERTHAFPDTVLLTTSGLTSLTGCPSSQLDTLTFLQIGHHFDRARSLPILRLFLASSLAPHLRFCPLCLREQSTPYYLLLWRFKPLIGCPTHACQLLERCSHCGAYIDYVSTIPTIAVCSSCRKDLRTCQATSLQRGEAQRCGRRYDDLLILLGAIDAGLDDHLATYIQHDNWSADLARSYAVLRQNRGYTLNEVAARLHTDPHMLLAIESPGVSKKATLLAYLQYADALGCTFLDLVFASAAHARTSIPPEESLLAQVDETMIELLRQTFCSPLQQGPVTLPTCAYVSRAIGLPLAIAKKYPRINKRLNAWVSLSKHIHSAQRHEKENELVVAVQSAIDKLKREDRKPGQRAVAREGGRDAQWLRTFPKVEALLIDVSRPYRGSQQRSRPQLERILARLPRF